MSSFDKAPHAISNIHPVKCRGIFPIPSELDTSMFLSLEIESVPVLDDSDILLGRGFTREQYECFLEPQLCKEDHLRFGFRSSDGALFEGEGNLLASGSAR
jgi:hypothetical protein